MDLNNKQNALILLQMIEQSKSSYLKGKFKTARQAFSDIRRNILLQ